MRRSLFRWSIEHLETQFAALSVILLGLVGIGLYIAVSAAITGQALQSAAAEAASDNAVLRPLLLARPAEQALPSDSVARLDQAIALQGRERFALVKVWSPTGLVLYSTEHAEIGQSFAPKDNPELGEALAGEVAAELSELDKLENKVEIALGFSHLLEVYTPLRADDGQVVGAVEVYRDGARLVQQVAGLRRLIGGGLLLGLAIVWLGLFGLIRRAGGALRAEHRAQVRLEHALEDTLRGVLSALSEAVEAKDSYTGGHVERVTGLSVALADRLGLPAEQRREVEYGALLHDVGKLSIPDAILLKPGPLTSEERRVMETHAAKGESILSKVPGLAAVGNLVRHHHERFDGAGYPDGLAGEAIPVGARIIAVADAYDAMTTDRPYRAALSHTAALTELRRVQGAQFDPALVAAFQQLPLARSQGGVA